MSASGTLINDHHSNSKKYDMNELERDNEYDKLNQEDSKSNSDGPTFVNHIDIDDNEVDHFRPNKNIPIVDIDEDPDEIALNEDPEYLVVKDKLKKEKVTTVDIAYLESKLHELSAINFDAAMMRILQHKIEQAHNGQIANKGIHKTEAPPYAFYDEDEMRLPNTQKFKRKLNEMNKRLYTENRIEWMDYVKLKEDESVDYRNDFGKFVIAKVMEKDGVELVLYTEEGQTVMINFLNQYPYQRLFKAGAVTARIPKRLRRKSVEIGSQIRLLCDTDFIMDSKWTKMECRVVDRDVDHDLDQVKQIQIEFVLNNKTHTLSTTNAEKHRMWVHLDNTQKLEDQYVEEEHEDDDDDDGVEPITITGQQQGLLDHFKQRAKSMLSSIKKDVVNDQVKKGVRSNTFLGGIKALFFGNDGKKQKQSDAPFTITRNIDSECKCDDDSDSERMNVLNELEEFEDEEYALEEKHDKDIDVMSSGRKKVTTLKLAEREQHYEFESSSSINSPEPKTPKGYIDDDDEPNRSITDLPKMEITTTNKKKRLKLADLQEYESVFDSVYAESLPLSSNEPAQVPIRSITDLPSVSVPSSCRSITGLPDLPSVIVGGYGSYNSYGESEHEEEHEQHYEFESPKRYIDDDDDKHVVPITSNDVAPNIKEDILIQSMFTNKNNGSKQKHGMLDHFKQRAKSMLSSIKKDVVNDERNKDISSSSGTCLDGVKALFKNDKKQIQTEDYTLIGIDLNLNECELTGEQNDVDGDIDDIDAECKCDEQMDVLNDLEEILNENMDNLIVAYHQFTEFKRHFLSENDSFGRDGIVTYGKEAYNNGINIPNKSGHNQRKQNRNTDNNNNNNINNNNSDKNGWNNNDGNSNGSDENKSENEICGDCNHLNECSECAHVLTQKYQQIKLFKSLVVTLQKQHEYHTLFEDMLCKSIANANQTKYKQSKAKPVPLVSFKNSSTDNKPRYDPTFGAKRNIKISKELTQHIIPKTVKQPISKVYSYLDKSIGLQYNDRQVMDHDDNKMLDSQYKVLNVDLKDKKSKESLYCVVEKLDSTKNAQYKWKMLDKLFKTEELLWCIALPQSSRTKLQQWTEMHDIHQLNFNQQFVINIMSKCKWNQIPVFNRKKNKRRITLSMTQEQFNPIIKRSLLRINEHRLIPILMFDDSSHWVEYVLIVNIERDIDIGISLKYNEENGVEITGIHLEKDMIFEQHEVLWPHKCKCLNGFRSIIDDIRIGNPDTLLNQVNNYKQKYYAFKQLILKFINGRDTQKYEILQKHAEMFIKHDNGFGT